MKKTYIVVFSQHDIGFASEEIMIRLNVRYYIKEKKYILYPNICIKTFYISIIIKPHFKFLLLLYTNIF